MSLVLLPTTPPLKFSVRSQPLSTPSHSSPEGRTQLLAASPGRETFFDTLSGTNVSLCQVISSPGTYVLTTDLTVNSSSLIPFSGLYSCFWINSTDVVLDGNGHRVTGPGPSSAPGGLDNQAVGTMDHTISGQNSSTIENFVISGFGRGINIRGFFHTIENNTVSNTQEAITLASNIHNSTITGNILFNNTVGDGRGVVMYWYASDPTSTFNVVTGNKIFNNNIGIDLLCSCTTGVRNNLFYNNFVADNTLNARQDGSGPNFYNVTEALGPNIMGGRLVGGNFWSDYAGNDTDFDGLGDTLLPYTSGGSIAAGGDFLPLSISFNTAINFTGVTVKTAGTFSLLSVSSALSLSLSGKFSVSATNATSGANLLSNHYMISTVPSRFLLEVDITPYPLSSNIVLTVSGTNVSISTGITRNIDMNEDGVVNNTDYQILQASYSCKIGQACYDPRSDLNGDGVVSFSDFLLESRFYGAPDYSPVNLYFSTSGSSPSTVDVGSSAVSTITLTTGSGFTGTVSLSDFVPFGLSCGAIAPSSLTVPPSPATASVSCTSSSAGTYVIVIAGTNGTLVHSASATFTFEDFSISSNPGSITFPTGSPGNSAISVGSLGGFTGTVILGWSASPSSDVGCSLRPSRVVVPNGTSATSTLICGGFPGNYTVTVTGTTPGLLPHSVMVALTITGGVVGGVILPVDKLALLAPYIGLFSMALAIVATIFLRRVKPSRKS
jgi:hypothetical protein